MLGVMRSILCASVAQNHPHLAKLAHDACPAPHTDEKKTNTTNTTKSNTAPPPRHGAGMPAAERDLDLGAMPVLVSSLAERGDRRAHTQQMLRRLGFENVSFDVAAPAGAEKLDLDALVRQAWNETCVCV